MNSRAGTKFPYNRTGLHKAKTGWGVLIFAILLLVFIFLIYLLIPRATKKLMSECKPEKKCPGKVVFEHHYNLIKQRDVDGQDILHVQSSDLTTIKKVCDLFEECQGFNSNGWLKSSVSSYNHGPADLYVKQEIVDTKRNGQSVLQSDYNSYISTMKVYVYDTTIGIEHHPRRIGGYGAERVFVEQLLKSPFVTQNPNEATFFFIPIRCSSYMLDFPSEIEAMQATKSIIGQVLAEIKESHPFWSWSGGCDHFYICAHDLGAEVGSELLKNAIALVNTADYEDPYFIPHKDISIPPYLSPGLSHLYRVGLGGASIDPLSRNIFVFFAGDLTSGRIRPTVLDLWSDDPDFVLKGVQLNPKTYVDYLSKSKFCLVLRGREVWSPRLMESLFMGCVPVILSDHYHLPLQGIVNWKEFSIVIPEKQVGHIKNILHRVTDQQLLEMQAKITSIYAHFVWNNPARPSDAFYSVMQQLWKKRHVVRYKSQL